ncbi:hypothetical protein CC86DRAFT_420173 [Ophiobolus disseminans]|uniref:Uncharacterized protein n=1 Tax=Ophiobolus disseminans TaxID=1469910 RepID=A0A6A6ZWC0_9PLEO|nr:hypothetical protein CC86DRAFT_420173 [Ophiobolus disseminans]
MELLDLPPELFQHIIHGVIEGSPCLREAWKLRRVCRTFAAEISYDILTKRPISDFQSKASDRCFLENCIHRYLVARLQSPHGINATFLAKLQSIVDWTVAETGPQTQRQRDDITEQVCAGLKHLVGRVLPDLSSNDRETTWCQFLPLTLALSRKDKALMNEILRYIEHALAGVERSKKLAIQGYLFDVSDAIEESIYYGYPEGLQDLLDFHENHLPGPGKFKFEVWVRNALMKHHQVLPHAGDYFIPLLNFRPGGTSMITRQIVALVCDFGTPSNIQHAQAYLGKDINEGTILALPIFVAVRSEHVAAVNTILDAGADVNITAQSNILSLKKENLTPLDVAIYKHSIPVIEALLNRGATPMPDFADWPTHARTYNFLRGHVMKISKKRVPTLKQFKWMDRAERQAFLF